MPYIKAIQAWARVIRRLWYIYSAPALRLPLQYVSSIANIIPLATVIARERLRDSSVPYGVPRVTVPGVGRTGLPSCNHPVMLPRANQHMAWWTCGACGARWLRVPGEVIQDVLVPEETVEG